MHSLKTKITVMTVSVIVIAMLIATVLGVVAIRDIGNQNSDQILLLLCESGEKNLDQYFDSVEQSVEMVSAYVESDLDGVEDEKLQAHLDRVSDIFKKMTNTTTGILTYYYRIDPELSKNVKGFWYVNQGDEGFVEHEVTDITQYDTSDTSSLVWFTVPKTTGKASWLPPYITENLGARVLSYNVPVYYQNRFVGVFGIEIDYSTMAEQVNNITLYDNGYAFINDSEGTIIYHPFISVEELEENHPKVPEGLLSEDKFIHYSFDGVEKQAVWLPLSNGMRLNVTVPVSEINEFWHKWGVQIVLIFAALLVLFIFVILRFSGKITKPLQELTEAAKEVDKGNYDFKLDYKGDDEVGILTSTFTQVTAHLQSYISDLNDLAYADALTGVHNKGAFDIFTQRIEAKIQNPDQEIEFAVGIFDCNDLKLINDQYGHAKGDIYLQMTCSLICDVFSHSPVFRIGGDEFAVFLLNKDFESREEYLGFFDLYAEEKRKTKENPWEKVNVAYGIAVYDPAKDKTVKEVVLRADKLMYENKRIMKEQTASKQPED